MRASGRVPAVRYDPRDRLLEGPVDVESQHSAENEERNAQEPLGRVARKEVVVQLLSERSEGAGPEKPDPGEPPYDEGEHQIRNDAEAQEAR